LLERERYREKRRQNDLAEQELAPVELLTHALVKSAAQIVPILETLPLKLKRSLPMLTGDEMDIVKREIIKCRNIIASLEIDLSD